MSELLVRRGTIQTVIVDTTTSGDNALVVGVAGQTITIHRITLFMNASNNITIKDGSTKLFGTMNFTASQGWEHDSDTHCPLVLTSGNTLNLNLSAASQVSGRIWYVQE